MANQPSQGDPGMRPESILTQEEIEALLGAARREGDAGAGLRSHVDAPPGPFERLPLLEPVLRKLADAAPRAIAALTGAPVQASLDAVVATKLGEYLDNVALPAMLGVWRAEAWNGRGLLVIDGALICALLDVLMGGRNSGAPSRIEGRPYSPIERAMVERLARPLLGELADAFRPVAAVELRLEALEPDPRFAAIARPDSAVALARIGVAVDGRAGRLEVVLPYATLDPVADKLRAAAETRQDPRWPPHITGEVKTSEARLEAVLARLTLKLREVLGWKVGTRLMLDRDARAPVELRAGDTPLLQGTIGRRGDRLAVKVEKWTSDERD